VGEGTTAAMTRRCRGAALLAVVALAAAGCNAHARSEDALTSAVTTIPALVTETTALPVVPTLPAPTTTVAMLAPPTTVAPAPPGLVDAVRSRLNDPRFAGTTVGVSVWVDGVGEVVASNADVALRPGSNEKLLVGVAALELLGADSTYKTEVRTAAAQEGGVLQGDLVLVGSGDPTLRSTGPNSLDVLAAQVRRAGITHIAGNLLGDERRYDGARSAPGWQAFHMPRFAGPLSAISVDKNWHRADAEFVADPVAANMSLFRDSLQRAGVRVAGGHGNGVLPEGSRVVASTASPPVGDIVVDMLNRSDNFVAELLAKEVGEVAKGRGTSLDGMRAAEEVAASLGAPLTGRSADGSGLSRENYRPPREWRALLVALRERPWAATFVEGLPIAGRSGTLVSRFRGTAAEGRVRAKTGSVREARALSGYLTTAGGRHVVFSLVVNGSAASSAIPAMDDLVAAMVASPA
jgi:D-alanyl-D-alanine carboxypeptidase/D-alanyl-D-alanine-endopeptidase (penicillin-binding protein 4)